MHYRDRLHRKCYQIRIICLTVLARFTRLARVGLDEASLKLPPLFNPVTVSFSVIILWWRNTFLSQFMPGAQTFRSNKFHEMLVNWVWSGGRRWPHVNKLDKWPWEAPSFTPNQGLWTPIGASLFIIITICLFADETQYFFHLQYLFYCPVGFSIHKICLGILVQN